MAIAVVRSMSRIPGDIMNGATVIGMFYRKLPSTFRWEGGGVACILPCACTVFLYVLCPVYHAADDYDVASSHMQKVLVSSLPTDLLRKAPRAVLRLLTGFSSLLVNCMCLLC